MDDKIYKLGLHEKFNNDDFEVVRVPGGWIYTRYRLDFNQINSVFIPFDNEFQQRNK